MTSIISESFDDAKVLDLRLLHEASKAGRVEVQLWTDESVVAVTGRAPKFPLAEREYFVSSMRFVSSVKPVEVTDASSIPVGSDGSNWFFRGDSSYAAQRLEKAKSAKALSGRELAGFPADQLTASGEMWKAPSARKKVVVTGCYDYFHSGHVRFFEECSELGDLYVCVGHDANVRALKGPRNPLYPDVERRYVTGCCRFVTQSLVTTGTGFMDAAPEFSRIGPDIYAVNEDGDKPEKAAWCEANGVEYRVLRRLPKAGLAARTSTDMRGF